MKDIFKEVKSYNLPVRKKLVNAFLKNSECL